MPSFLYGLASRRGGQSSNATCSHLIQSQRSRTAVKSAASRRVDVSIALLRQRLTESVKSAHQYLMWTSKQSVADRKCVSREEPPAVRVRALQVDKGNKILRNRNFSSKRPYNDCTSAIRIVVYGLERAQIFCRMALQRQKNI